MEKFLVPIPHLPHHSGEWSRDTQSHSHSPNVPCYLSMMSSCRVRASTVPSNQVLPMGSPVDPAAPHSGIPVPWRRPTLIDPPPRGCICLCVCLVVPAGCALQHRDNGIKARAVASCDRSYSVSCGVEFQVCLLLLLLRWEVGFSWCVGPVLLRRIVGC